jgi:hypothetical protein
MCAESISCCILHTLYVVLRGVELLVKRKHLAFNLTSCSSDTEILAPIHPEIARQRTFEFGLNLASYLLTLRGYKQLNARLSSM